MEGVDFVEKCPVCASNGSKCLYNKHGLAYRKCRVCGLMYASPRPSSEIIEARLEMFADQIPSSAQSLQDRVNFQMERTRLIKSFIPSGKLLDFGCGDGSFVKAAKITGYDAVGIEKANGAADYASKYYDVVVHPGDIQNIDLSQMQFDIITLWDVLEHLPDPVSICNILAKLLSKNGMLVILTPHSEGLSAKLKRSDYWVFGPRDHVCLFSTKTIKYFLQKTGLHVECVTTKDLVPWNPPEYKGEESMMAKVWRKLSVNGTFLEALSKLTLGDWLFTVAIRDSNPLNE